MKEDKTLAHDSNSSSRDVLPRLKEIVGVISAAGSMFILLLWLAGRSYAAGYFSAMNIPSFHVSFPVWEYAEASWFPLSLYALTAVLVSGLLVGVIFVLANPWFVRFALWLQKTVKKHVPQGSSDLSLPATTMFYVAYLACVGGGVLFAALASLQFVFSWGQSSGRQMVLEHANQVRIVSETTQALGTPTIMPSAVSGNTSNLLLYDNLRLLAYNGGKYYLFKDIDPVSCKPREVYVVSDAQFIQINILPPTSLTPGCLLSSGQGVSIQKTPFAVPPTP